MRWEGEDITKWRGTGRVRSRLPSELEILFVDSTYKIHLESPHLRSQVPEYGVHRLVTLDVAHFIVQPDPSAMIRSNCCHAVRRHLEANSFLEKH